MAFYGISKNFYRKFRSKDKYYCKDYCEKRYEYIARIVYHFFCYSEEKPQERNDCEY